MQSIFSDSAVLEMNVKTENIAFPSKTKGLDLITDVLVKKFNETYENIYTFCLSDSIQQNIECRWLVGMTTKESGELRIGHGTYAWEFDKELPLVNHLTITIDAMLILKPQHTTLIMNWLDQLPYPWCETADINNSMPKLEGLMPL